MGTPTVRGGHLQEQQPRRQMHKSRSESKRQHRQPHGKQGRQPSWIQGRQYPLKEGRQPSGVEGMHTSSLENKRQQQQPPWAERMQHLHQQQSEARQHQQPSSTGSNQHQHHTVYQYNSHSAKAPGKRQRKRPRETPNALNANAHVALTSARRICKSQEDASSIVGFLLKQHNYDWKTGGKMGGSKTSGPQHAKAT